MKLEELARQTATENKNEPSFREHYPDPALVFLVSLGTPESEKEPRINTPPSGAFDANRTVVRPTEQFDAGAYRIFGKKKNMDETHEREAPKGVYKVMGNSEVVFLKKSGRNPFGNMITV